MPDYTDFGRSQATPGGTKTVTGSDSPQDDSTYATSSDLQDQADEDAYAKTVPGASGIAGARVRSTPEYKAGLAAFKTKQRAARAAAKKPKSAPTGDPIVKTGM